MSGITKAHRSTGLPGDVVGYQTIYDLFRSNIAFEAEMQKG